jgi:hypothetical protein
MKEQAKKRTNLAICPVQSISQAKTLKDGVLCLIQPIYGWLSIRLSPTITALHTRVDSTSVESRFLLHYSIASCFYETMYLP